MDDMKDSGIPWLGEIPAEWKVFRNKYVMTKVKDIQSHYQGEDILSLTMNGVVVRDLDNPVGKMPATFDGYQKLEPGNLLMCLFDIDVTPRCVGIIKNYGLSSPAYTQFKIKNKDNIEYLYYYYLYLDDKKELLHIAKNLRHALTAEQLGVVPVLIPPKEEQKRIADFLDEKCGEIDGIVVKIQQEVETLKQYKQSIVSEAVTKGIRPNVPMKDSGIDYLGKIPASWSFPKITHILDHLHNYPIGDGDHGTIKADAYSDSGIPFIRVQNLGYSPELKLDNVVYITEEQNKNIKNSTLHPGDILFAKTGATIGKVGIMPDYLPKANTTSHVGKITVNKKTEPKYICYFLSSNIGYKQLWDIAALKSTRPELSIDEIKTIRVLYPPLEEQREIAAYLDQKCAAIDGIISSKEEQLQTLASYKKSLIYEYVTGKKRVPTA